MKRLSLIALVVSGCAGTWQERVETAASRVAQVSLVETQDVRTAYYERLDDECRASSDSFGAWHQCMTPAYRLDRAVGLADSSFRLLAEALQIAAPEADVRERAASALHAVRYLLSVLRAQDVPVPAEVIQVIDVVEALL